VTAVVRLAVWSGPRNISTALMRSWENRSDSMVVDEPLYAHYLAVTGLDHPGRDEVVAAGETDWRRVVTTLLGPVPAGVDVYYQKHMAHHLTDDIDRAWISQLTNVLLIREPREVVTSYLRSRDSVTASDIGLPQQVRLYDELRGAGATAPLVIDSGDFLRRPGDYLRGLCDRIGVPFRDSMLSWPPGPRSSDGVWGRYWYDAVWRSTGFEQPQPRAPEVTGAGADVVAACRPLYDRLYSVRWVLD
jgi:Sulfotransferase domain